MAAELVRYLLIPAGLAALVYLLTHAQLLLMDRLIKVEIHRQTRTRICIWAAMMAFALVLGLVLFREVYR